MQMANECLHGTRLSILFDTHMWGLPYFPNLPPTQENMEGQYNPNLTAQKTEVLSEGH